jgi:hypothetical protein
MQKTKLPGQFALLWLLFMQPITLHHRLKACGIEKPDVLAWQLWWAKENRAINRAYIKKMFALLLWATPVGALLLSIFADVLSYPLNPVKVAVGVAVGMAVGVTVGMAVGVVVGVALGVALGVVVGVVVGVVGSVALGVVVGVVVAILAFGVAVDVAIDVADGVADVSFIPISANLRLILFYPIELLLQLIFYTVQILTNRSTLHLVPVLYHELSYFPHSFLLRHILINADTHPKTVARVLDACAIAPGQQRIGQTALAHLQANELATLAKNHQFQSVIDLQSQWLSGVESADKKLLAFRDTARYLQAALNNKTAYHRLQHIKSAEKALTALTNQLRSDDSLLARLLTNTLHTWQNVTARLRQETEASANIIPNPFRASKPLTPNYDRAIFRGRDELIQRIAALLAHPDESSSIALLGPRRCGKTSILKMLPALVPDAVFVFFDIQGNPMDTPMDFFQALAKRAKEQAQQDRRLDLPPLPDALPFKALSQWFENLEKLGKTQGHRILLCIDEFERLETHFPGDKTDLLKFMGLLRATIQHRRHLRLLVSGAAPFDELDILWSDHFINVQELRVGLLERQTSLDLLTKPIPEFPVDAIPQTVAAAIFERVNGQPFLLQLYAYLLVNHLNEATRVQAELKDVTIIENIVLSQAKNYFRNIFFTAPENVQTALKNLALGKTAPHNCHRWLKRRCLLNEQEKLSIPVLGAWILENLEINE